jgi:vancomycin resistance protein YoaR
VTHIKKHIFNILTIFIWVFLVYFFISVFLNVFFKNRILTNTYLGNVSLQGMKIDTVKENLKNFSENLNKDVFVLNISGNTFRIDNILNKVNDEKNTNAMKYIDFDYEKALEKINKNNQNITLLEFPLQLLKNYFLETNIAKDVLVINKTELNKFINQKLSEMELDKKEYNLIYQNSTFFIENNRNGLKIDIENLENSFFTINNLTKNSEINIYPEIQIEITTRKKEEVVPFLNIANEIQQKIEPVTLSFFSNLDKRQKSLTANRENLLSNITINENKDETLYLGFNKIKLIETISQIKKEVEVPAKNASLETDPNNPKKVLKIEYPENGIEVDVENLILEMEKSLVKNLQTPLKQNFVNIEVKTRIVEPEIKENTFGIKELLGTGWSNFAKSDAARLHNINTAIYKINRLLIAPGENFSLGNALAPFTNANGYVDGLVIKGKKIIPETGGGMCQLGTTMFRSAMNSGMPITERRNHSLWLKYYDDPKNGNPGTDATIYAGAPDLKFKNDTGKYLMIKAYSTQNADLLIELWGTKDGRIGSYTAPQITNLVIPEKDADTETIIVKELKPGEIHCNGPFKGASTVFNYTIKRVNGEIEKQTFHSYYKPQKLICQVGPDAGYFDN